MVNNKIILVLDADLKRVLDAQDALIESITRFKAGVKRIEKVLEVPADAQA